MKHQLCSLKRNHPDVSKTLDYKTQLEIFLVINSWGVPQAEEHIKKLKKEYSKLS